MTKLLLSLTLGLLSFFSNAASVPVSFTNEGFEGQSTIFRGELGASGLAQLGSVSIVDSNSGAGGSPGVFSGFDLDFVFLDLDGVYTTTNDRVFGQTFAFSTGAIRATSDPAFQPSAIRPGPTFGSLSADTIDHTLSTLNTRDGSFPSPHVDTVFGILTLGDGGSLTLGFAPITLSGTEALFIGELSTNIGELVGANVLVSPIPEPGPLALWCIGLAGLGLLGGPWHPRNQTAESMRIRSDTL